MMQTAILLSMVNSALFQQCQKHAAGAGLSLTMNHEKNIVSGRMTTTLLLGIPNAATSSFSAMTVGLAKMVSSTARIVRDGWQKSIDNGLRVSGFTASPDGYISWGIMTFEEWWQPTKEYVNTTTEYERQRNTWEAATLAAQQEWVRQQEEITDMCIVSWVSTMGTLKEKVMRLIQWEISVALDPAVSGDAQALIRLGKLEAAREMLEMMEAYQTSYDLIGYEIETVGTIAKRFSEAIAKHFGLEI